MIYCDYLYPLIPRGCTDIRYSAGWRVGSLRIDGSDFGVITLLSARVTDETQRN